MLRCPKCQMALKLPGKAAVASASLPPLGADQQAQPPAAPTSPSPTPSSPGAGPRPSAVSSEGHQVPSPSPVAPPPARLPAPPSSSSSTAEPAGDSGANPQALIVLTGEMVTALQGVSALLQRSGYGVETARELQQGIQLLERSRYEVVVTTPNGAPQGSGSVYKRVAGIAPDVRREIFLVLLGSEFSSGDGTQAFAAMADLVLNPKDVEISDELLRSTLSERSRLYKPFIEAQLRLDRRKY
jgi:hypothetical protein